MHLMMTALGSYGDVHPFVGLGVAMRRRGHQVQILANPHFQTVIESAGLGFLPVGTDQEYEELALRPELFHPFRGPSLVLRTCAQETLRPIYELISGHYRAGETVLVAHGLDLASRLFQEKHDAPLASVHLAPVVLRSFYESPQVFGMLMASGLPRWFRRAQYWLADRLVLDRLLGPPLNAYRQELGLLPVRDIMKAWYYSPQRVLGLFPEWFAAPQPDWPANTRLTGFPLWDQSATQELPNEVSEFLDAGSPPIVFAPGSAMTHGEAFFGAAAEACRRLSRRGILLTQYPEQLPKDLPPEVRHFDFVPFSQLLPRAAALVHHGGIGTSAQGLAAGLPQLVSPMAYDQHDNAARLKRLGVGAIVRRSKLSGRTVAQTLDELLAKKSTHEQCHHWAQEIDAEAAMTASCELLEQLGPPQNPKTDSTV